MTRILIDTNIFVGAAYNPGSASRNIIQAVEAGRLTLIVSPPILREYDVVLPKAIRREEARREVSRVLELAESVSPERTPKVTADRSDDKFLAAGVAAAAHAIVSSDAHLLEAHPYQGIEILRPTVFWERHREAAGGEDS